ncbi:HNH endonuclease signature motif containing protein [Acetobacter pasteurianus]
MPRKTTPAIERLNSKLVEVPAPPGSTIQSPCKIFGGGKFHNGYGAIQVDQKKVKAHRLAYEDEKGPIPPGQYIRHKCGNRACCNVNHMELGTQDENFYDCIAEGNQIFAKPHHVLFKVLKCLDDGKTIQEIADDLRIDCEEVESLSEFWDYFGAEFGYRQEILAPFGKAGKDQLHQWLDERLVENRQAYNGAVVLCNEMSQPQPHSQAAS